MRGELKSFGNKGWRQILRIGIYFKILGLAGPFPAVY